MIVTPGIEQRLRGIRKIYSHDRCADGTSAAATCAAAMWILGKKNRQDYDIELIQYGSRNHSAIVPSPGCLFVDITPVIDTNWEAWKEHGPIVLDHHPTAKSVVEGLGGVYGARDESGTSLAFKHVLRPALEIRMISDPMWADTFSVDRWMEKWEMFSALCAVRDTWQDKHPSWQAAQAMARGVLFHNPWKVIAPAAEGGSLNGRKDPWGLYQLGLDVLRKDLKRAYGMSRGAYRFTAGDLKCGIFNCTEALVSEACHSLLEEGDDLVDLACCYFMTVEDGAIRHVVSLRSKPGTIACNAIAKFLGGGGHELAAGFRIDSPDTSVSSLISLIRGAVDHVRSGVNSGP